MVGRGRAQQVAVEPRPGFEQIEQRQLRPQPELERDVAELHVEVDQAGFAAARRFVLREADRELACISAVAPTPPTLLMTVTSLALSACRSFATLADLVAERRERGFEIIDAERQRHDVVRAGADQRPHQRQRRIVGSGDERRVGRPARASGIA